MSLVRILGGCWGRGGEVCGEGWRGDGWFVGEGWDGGSMEFSGGGLREYDVYVCICFWATFMLWCR